MQCGAVADDTEVAVGARGVLWYSSGMWRALVLSLVVLMAGCDTQLKFKEREPKRYSDVRWEDDSCDRDDDQPRLVIVEEVHYTWDVEKR